MFFIQATVDGISFVIFYGCGRRSQVDYLSALQSCNMHMHLLRAAWGCRASTARVPGSSGRSFPLAASGSGTIAPTECFFATAFSGMEEVMPTPRVSLFCLCLCPAKLLFHLPIPNPLSLPCLCPSPKLNLPVLLRCIPPRAAASAPLSGAPVSS